MLLDRTLHDSAQRHPDKLALVCGERRVTYAEVNNGANALAHGLLKLGLQRQQRVVIFLDNSVEAVQAIYAAMKAAGMFVVVNPQTKGDKLAFILNDAEASILVTTTRLYEAVASDLQGCPSLQHVLLADLDGRVAQRPGADALRASGKPVHLAAELMAAEPTDLPHNPNINLDLASLIYTSGSTGQPKGVMLTHLNMRTAVSAITGLLHNVPDDVILSPLPLAFNYGLYQVLMVFTFGGTLVLEKQLAYPYRYIELVHKERVTGLPIVPTISAILLNLKDLEQHDFSSVRYLTNTAQALPEHHVRRLRELMPQAKLYSMYGLTECKRGTCLPPDLIDRKPTSVGFAIPGTEAWIEDDEGRPVSEPGVPGELIVRGAHVMAGYWKRPEDTARALRPGRYPYERELRTGDLFRRDEDGHLYFISRRDDIIKTAGERVGPREVENVLYELEDVKEAAVIGVPDDMLGRAIKAFVALREGATLTERELILHCQRRLERFMVPKHVAFVAELPRTSTGKISKQGLA
jgi:amino acid adenylation domain-containing protein